MKDLRLDIIQHKLKTSYVGRNMIYFKNICSTNEFALSLCKKVEENNIKNPKKFINLNGAVIFAGFQSNGKGRLGRKWISPHGGLWLTIIKKCKILNYETPKITIITAASILNMLKLYIQKDLYINWPNDIYCNGKKLAGILCEAENIGRSLYLLLGIGINVNFHGSEILKDGIDAISVLDITNRFYDLNTMLLIMTLC